jgi:HTH-type transcriptional regulator/antitoxin MqsA
MSGAKEPCPFCDCGVLEENRRDREIELEGSIAIVRGLLFSVCNNCAMETVTPRQSRLNKWSIINAQKTIQGLLAAQEINLLRKQLGITQVEAAQLFGGGVNAFSKYERNSITQTKAMDNVLRLVRDVPGAAEYLAKRENVQLRSITQDTSITQTIGFIETVIQGRQNQLRYVGSFGGGNSYAIVQKDVGSMQISTNLLSEKAGPSGPICTVTKHTQLKH